MDAAIREVMQELPPALDESGRIDANSLIELRDGDDETAHQRRRCWWFIVWPESCNIKKLWRIIDDSKLPVAVSPLHDRDVKDDGSPDKPHYHIIVRFPHAKALDPVRRIIGSWLLSADGLLAQEKQVDPVWYVRPVEDYATVLRYLCHLDTPEKAQYEVNQVLTFGYMDVSMLYARSLADDVHAFAQLLAYCRNHPRMNWQTLCNYVFDSQDMTLLRALKSNGYMLRSYLLAGHEGGEVKDY